MTLLVVRRTRAWGKRLLLGGLRMVLAVLAVMAAGCQRNQMTLGETRDFVEGEVFVVRDTPLRLRLLGVRGTRATVNSGLVVRGYEVAVQLWEGSRNASLAITGVGPSTATWGGYEIIVQHADEYARPSTARLMVRSAGGGGSSASTKAPMPPAQ